MKLFKSVGKLLEKIFYQPRWRCVSCGKEIFDGEYFCGKCKKSLPFIQGAICEHCGRQTVANENYCSTCKNRLTATDKARSVFNFEKPVNTLIRKAKYDNARYLLGIFAEYLSAAYFKNGFNADALVFVPMTKKDLRRRGYNQTEILANKLSERINVPVSDVLFKKRETKRQAGLSAERRKQNLTDAFAVTDKSAVAGKNLLIVDDVTTTGSTAEAIAVKLKKAGARTVSLLTVASVPPKDKY